MKYERRVDFGLIRDTGMSAHQYEQKNANICATFSKFHLFIEAFLNVIRTAG